MPAMATVWASPRCSRSWPARAHRRRQWSVPSFFLHALRWRDSGASPMNRTEPNDPFPREGGRCAGSVIVAKLLFRAEAYGMCRKPTNLMQTYRNRVCWTALGIP